jgi:hypothetical protein
MRWVAIGTSRHFAAVPKVPTLLEVKRTCRDGGQYVDATRLTHKRHRRAMTHNAALW